MNEVDIDTRERLIRLEVENEHLRDAIDKMGKTVDKMASQLSEMHDLLHQARGARWIVMVVIATVAGIGGFAAGVSKLASWIPR